MLAETSGDGEEMGTGGGVLGFGVGARSDSNCTSLLEQRDDVDDVIHSLPAIGTAHEVVAAVVVGRAARSGVGRVAVEVLEMAAVPVDDLLLLDVLVDRGVLGLVSGDVRLGEIEPGVVGPIR